jgi:hypothetical protein
MPEQVKIEEIVTADLAAAIHALSNVQRKLLGPTRWTVKTKEDARYLRDDLISSKYWLDQALDEVNKEIRRLPD